MPHGMHRTTILACCAAATASVYGQHPTYPPNRGPDVLMFSYGEKILGHLENVISWSVAFKSEVAGEVSVDSNKAQELRANQLFAGGVMGRFFTEMAARVVLFFNFHCLKES